MDFEKIKESVCEVLASHDKDYEYSSITRMVEDWSSAKSGLISMLRRHPNWNENALAVILTTEEIRDISCREIRDSIWELCKLTTGEHKNFTDWIFNVVYYTSAQFVDPNFISRSKPYGYEPKEGQKISRCINAVCKKEGVDKDPDYNRVYARVADAFNPLKVKRTSVLSVHPCDFLHMTHGFNSCHNIDDGCYMAGTLSYMGDEVSMIFYTIADDYENAEYMEKKITRNVFCYEDQVLMQSRCYPRNDEDRKKHYREIVQSIISLCEEIPNLWVKKGSEFVMDYCETHCDAKHYPDYEYDEYEANVSMPKDYKTAHRMVIGSTCYCLTCDNEVYEEAELYCDSCRDGCYCADCGDRINKDDAYYIDGEYYCDNCVSYCDCCDESVRSDMTYVGDSWVCESCLENYYSRCEDCGEYVHKDEIMYIEDKQIDVCPDCLKSGRYFECSECYSYYSKEEESVIDCMVVCTDCKEFLQGNKKSNEAEVAVS